MPDCQTIEQWLKIASVQLTAARVSTPKLDAKLILQDVLGFSSAQMIARSDEVIETKYLQNANQCLQRRLEGESVHRILGWREFYGRKFRLSKETLEPRPDTETLIDHVLQRAASSEKSLRMLDVGTGSGAIAVTLAAELPNAKVTAIDISDNALTTANLNAEAINVSDRIEFRNSDLFSNIDEKFDFIVSNPPYIPDGDISSLQKEVQGYDPHAALSGGEDGLDFYREIFKGACHYLVPGGEVWVEFGIGQDVDVQAIAEHEKYEVIEIGQDLSGTKRVLGTQVR